jgi:hypothetical protein
MVKERQEIIQLLGGRCVRCGFEDVRALQVDHRYGDGADERRDYSGAAYYRHILRSLHTGRYQLLCANCNAIKRVENFEDRKFRLEEYELELMTNEYDQEVPDGKH